MKQLLLLAVLASNAQASLTLFTLIYYINGFRRPKDHQ